MKRFFWTSLALSTSLLAQGTDAVLVNGKIVTADAAFSIQQAVGVPDGKIAALGTTAHSQTCRREGFTSLSTLMNCTVCGDLSTVWAHAAPLSTSIRINDRWRSFIGITRRYYNSAAVCMNMQLRPPIFRTR
ncbi:MAG: hypothetical protein JO336_10360 [Acidobacteriia bacterium]|nr:hypothetical protein [Terriglobia bacterium]MBV8904496.1 hypothetical protein [Terriglobia bacterium]MBV9744364.1 hypothetical protein [Terriglobia bacterium]